MDNYHYRLFEAYTLFTALDCWLMADIFATKLRAEIDAGRLKC